MKVYLSSSRGDKIKKFKKQETLEFDNEIKRIIFKKKMTGEQNSRDA